MKQPLLTRRLPDRMRTKITPNFVKEAPLPEKGDRVIYWDERRPGFGLMVSADRHLSG